MFMADLCYIFIYQMWLMSLMLMADFAIFSYTIGGGLETYRYTK